MKKLTHLLKASTALGILLIFLAGCTSPGPQMSGVESSEFDQLDDETINVHVKATLMEDELVSDRPIHSRTVYGVVWLTGFVDSELESARVEELVSGVSGVENIINHIKVQGGGDLYGGREE